MRIVPVLLAAVAASSLFACAEPVPPKSAAPGAPSAEASAAPSATSAASTAAPAAPPAPAGTATASSASKPMLGLDLPPFGAWKATWDAEAKVAKWENKDVFFGIKVKQLKDKLDTLDDLKRAAPMMSEVGTEITRVLNGPRTTPKGWYALVESSEGQSQEFLYVQKLGGMTLLCSAAIKTESTGDTGITPKIALAACDSIKLAP